MEPIHRIWVRLSNTMWIAEWPWTNSRAPLTFPIQVSMYHRPPTTINCSLKRPTSISLRSCHREIFKIKSTARWKRWNRASAPNWKVYCWIPIRTVILIRAPMRTMLFSMVAAISIPMIRSLVLNRRKPRWDSNCLRWPRPTTTATASISMDCQTIIWPMDRWMAMAMEMGWPIIMGQRIARRHCVCFSLSWMIIIGRWGGRWLPPSTPPFESDQLRD